MQRFAALALVMLGALLTACGATTPSSTGASPATAGNVSTPPVSPSTAALTTDPPMPSAMSATAEQHSALTVFAAASLSEAFGEIGKNFDAANSSTTTFNFAGSQQLAQQISQGAPADVFASANRAQMVKVIDAGQVISGTQQTFVRNRLVVIYPKDNPAQLTKLTDLTKPDIKIVLAAEQVPVGQYSLEFLRKASVRPEFTAAYGERVLANVVSYEENVRAVLSKVALGEADAGIVYSSDIALDAAAKVGRIDIPDQLNTIAAYSIAPLKDTRQAELAQRFVEYVLSPEAQQILVNYGFIPATGHLSEAVAHPVIK